MASGLKDDMLSEYQDRDIESLDCDYDNKTASFYILAGLRHVRRESTAGQLQLRYTVIGKWILALG